MSGDLRPSYRGAASASSKERFDRTEPNATVPYATALRYGRGTKADTRGARAVLEAALAANDESARRPSADMLATARAAPPTVNALAPPAEQAA
jgi:hypothetical protein